MKRCPGCKHWKDKLQKTGLCTECDSKGVGYRSMNNSHSATGELADIPAGFTVPAGLPLRMAGDA